MINELIYFIFTLSYFVIGILIEFLFYRHEQVPETEFDNILTSLLLVIIWPLIGLYLIYSKIKTFIKEKRHDERNNN